MTGKVDTDHEGLSDDDIDDLFDVEAEATDEVDETKDESTDDSDQDEDEDEDTSDENDSDDDDEAGDEDTSTPEGEGRKTVPLKALLEERRKAKEYKERLEELESQRTDQVDDELGPEPDRFEYPDEHDAWLQKRWDLNNQRETQRKYVETVEESRSKALEKHTDYLEVEEVFMAMSDKDPALAQEMLNSKDPAEFAYAKGKERIKAQKDALRAEVLAEMEAERLAQGGEVDTKATGKKRKTPSLATATAAASNSTHIEKEDDLDEMFSDQKY